jgi:hypothetical protein
VAAEWVRDHCCCWLMWWHNDMTAETDTETLTIMLCKDKVITQYTIFKSFFMIPLHKWPAWF